MNNKIVQEILSQQPKMCKYDPLKELEASLAYIVKRFPYFANKNHSKSKRNDKKTIS